jgi:hypothetical protein
LICEVGASGPLRYPRLLLNELPAEQNIDPLPPVVYFSTEFSLPQSNSMQGMNFAVSKMLKFG